MGFTKHNIEFYSREGFITNNILFSCSIFFAKKIFNLKCKGSTLVMRWRKDRQDIEVITGYTRVSSSDRRIRMPEYEEEDKETESTESKLESNLHGKSLPRT
jgi:hypothetical protein